MGELGERYGGFPGWRQLVPPLSFIDLKAHRLTYCDPIHVLVYLLGKGLDSVS